MDLHLLWLRRVFAAGSILLPLSLCAVAQSDPQTTSANQALSASGQSDPISPNQSGAGQSGAGLGAGSKAVPAPAPGTSTGDFGPDPTPSASATERHDTGSNRGPHGPGGSGGHGNGHHSGGFGARNGNESGDHSSEDGSHGFEDGPRDGQSTAYSGATSFGGNSDNLGLNGNTGSVNSFGMRGSHMGGRGGMSGGMNAMGSDMGDMGGGMRGRGMGQMGQGGALNLNSLFRIADAWTEAASRSAGPNSALGTTLNGISRAEHIAQGGSLSLPFASSAGRFNFGYRESIGHGPNGMGAEVGEGSAQASFNSRGFKNDLMHFSATATYGGMRGGMGSFGGNGSDGVISSFSEAGGATGAGIGSDSGSGSGHGSGSPFSTTNSGMGGGMGGRGGFMPPSSSGANGMGMNNMGSRGRQGAASTPAVSLKLSF